MKKFLLLTTIFCVLLCSCSSPSNDVNDQTTPSDTTTVALVTTVTEDTSITETTAPEPFESSVYNVLKEYFKAATKTSQAQAVVVTSSYDLLDVYRYIMSDDAEWYMCLRYKNVDGSAYNDYLNNTYTPDFFGHGLDGGDNYLIAVMIRSASSSDRYAVSATADNAIHVKIEAAPSSESPTDDGGYFIYLVPMEGVYQGQELIIN